MKIRYIISEGFYRVEYNTDDQSVHDKGPFVDLFVFEHDNIVSIYF